MPIQTDYAQRLAHMFTASPTGCPRRLDGTAKTVEEVAVCILIGTDAGLSPTTSAYEVQAAKSNQFTLPFSRIAQLMERAKHQYAVQYPDPSTLDDNELMHVRAIIKDKDDQILVEERATITATLTDDGQPTQETKDNINKAGRIVLTRLFCKVDPDITGAITGCHDEYDGHHPPTWLTRIQRAELDTFARQHDEQTGGRLPALIADLGGLTEIARHPDYHQIRALLTTLAKHWSAD